MKKIILAISLLFVLPLMLVTSAALGRESSDIGKIRTAIETANKEFMAAYNRGDAAGVAACYTADARLLPPNQEMMKGRQAIQSFWQGAMDMGVKKVELETVEVEAREDMAYEIGKYTLIIQPAEGDAITAKGKYVVVWKHQAGSWKLDVDIWNSRPSPAATSVGAETMKCRAVVFHTKSQINKVGDVDGHIMGVGESSGLASYETGEVAVVKLNWFADYTKGTGMTQGYFRHTFEDGSTIDYKYVSKTRPDPKGKGSLFDHVSLLITQGSGKYAGIKGKGTQTGRRVAPLGAGAQFYVDINVTYTLP